MIGAASTGQWSFRDYGAYPTSRLYSEWSARMASSTYSSAISTLTLISEVEIAWILMPFSASVLEHGLGNAGVAAHADADDRDLGDVVFRHQILVADLGGSVSRSPPPRWPRSARAVVKVMLVLRPSSESACAIMSTLMPASASGPKIDGRDAGLIGHAEQGDLGLVARAGDAGDRVLFHDVFLVAENGAAAVGIEGR